MKLTNKKELSKWACNECWEGNDTQEMRDLITDSHHAYLYCYCIKDIEEMWKKITDSEWAYYYCERIKDREEVRVYIK